MDPKLRSALQLTLDDTEREIDDLQRVARHLRERLGLSNGAVPDLPLAELERIAPPLRDDEIVSLGELAGLTSRQAAIKVLEKVGRPLRVDDLLRLLRRGGLDLSGKHARNTLRRNLFADPAFVHPSGSSHLWTLARSEQRAKHEEDGLGLG